MSTIAEWLKSLGPSKYTDGFVENGVDVSVLPNLTEQDLNLLASRNRGDAVVGPFIFGRVILQRPGQWSFKLVAHQRVRRSPYGARSADSTLHGPPSALSCVVENSRPRTTVLPGATGWWMATPRLSCGLAGSPLIWQDTTTFRNGNGLSFLRVKSTINSFRDCRQVCSITDNLPARSCAACGG